VLPCVMVSCASAEKRPVHTRDDFIGTWTGFSEDLSYTCRLELLPDNTGLFAFKFLDKEAAIYSVESWNLQRERILTHLKQIRPYAGPFQLALEVRWFNRIDSAISGEYNNSKWTISARLPRESFINGKRVSPGYSSITA